MNAPLAPQTEERLESVIVQELKKFSPHDHFSACNSPPFWHAIFRAYFEREPSGEDDPDWDILLSERLPILHKLGY